jgi:succinate dehydrogenase hydrophobic anchor subunit
MKNWIKENWIFILILWIIFVAMYLLYADLSTPETRQMLEKPLSDLNFFDLLILVIIHAILNKSKK